MARAGLTGERLAVAGADLADELGFDQVTVSALARRFDVQVASLYSHVRNSDDLKTRIATVALTELADQAAHAVAGRAGADALAALADVYRTYAQTHPGRYTASRYLPPTPHPPAATPSAAAPTPHPPAATPTPHPSSAAPSAAAPTPHPPAAAPSAAAPAPQPPAAAPAPHQRARRTPSTSVLGTEYMSAGRRHSELMRAVLRAYDLDEPAETDAVRLLGSVIHGYVTLELAGSFSHSQPDSADSWPRILAALDNLLRNWS
ncbi:TetR/AcrR family transcriptional regulator [Kribbella sp. NPDC004536]|uniref:TetR/AcrR family transcriptional regulator n=1 Tax=Kribbella sp. NPDC004536 TaxID=3364106 RepID=UPI0036BEFBB1